MKKAIILILLALIPVFFALLGYVGPGGSDTPANHTQIKALLVNPFSVGMLGGIVAIVLQHKRSMWWAMIVCFIYTYLGFGLVWGEFAKNGLFHMENLNLSALFSVIGFVCALLMYGMVNLLKKATEAIEKQK